MIVYHRRGEMTTCFVGGLETSEDCFLMSVLVCTIGPLQWDWERELPTRTGKAVSMSMEIFFSFS